MGSVFSGDRDEDAYEYDGRRTCVSMAGIIYQFGKVSDKRITNMFFPLNGNGEEYTPEERTKYLTYINGETVRLHTRDGVSLDAVWSEPLYPDETPGGCVILFHGNSMTLDNWGSYAHWFHSLGMKVLMFTIRGYPGSDGDINKSGEVGLYADAEAAIKYCLEEKNIDREKLLLHGYSIGGSLAAGGAYYFDLPLVLDHTFTSAGDVSGKVGKLISSHIPRWLGMAVARGAFAKGKTMDADGTFSPKNSKPKKKNSISKADSSRDESELDESKLDDDDLEDYIKRDDNGEVIFESDGLNSLKKVERLRQPVFIIYGTNDELMPVSFAHKFFEAAYGKKPLKTMHRKKQAFKWERLEFRRMAVCEYGRHCDHYINYPAELVKYRRFLAYLGMIDEQYDVDSL